MGKECVAVHCTNRDTDKSLVGVKFHRIPRSEPRRSLWLRAINRKDPVSGKLWIPGDDTARVCSEHFIAGKSDDPLSPDYIPSINLGYESKTPDSTSIKRYERVIQRQTLKTEVKSKRQLDFTSEDNRSAAAADALVDLSNTPCNQPGSSSKDTENSVKYFCGNTSHDSCLRVIATSNLEKKQLLRELERLQLENDKLKSGRRFLRAEHLCQEKPDEITLFYSGLPSHTCFLWLVNFISCILPPSKLLNSADILLLVLMKLRNNFPHKDLAYRFGISSSLVTNLLDRAIPEVAKKLNFFVHWPSKDDIFRIRPQCFKETFPKCVSVIDCTEVFIDCPSNFTARSGTYSNYKHTNTIKFLVSITPCGSISFISRAFGGRTSDKVITYRSGYLDMIQHGDVVMADRGFLISDELLSRGAQLIIPSFVKGKDQLSANEVERSRKIAHVRIHVERAMERLKNFRILSQRMSLNMVPHCDSIMTICAAVTNMHLNLVN